MPWTNTRVAASVPEPVGSEKSSDTLGLRRASFCLLRVPQARGHVDRGSAVPIVRGHRPDDRLLAAIDRRVFAGDEVLEHVADLGWQARGHRVRVLRRTEDLAVIQRSYSRDRRAAAPGADRPLRRLGEGLAPTTRSRAVGQHLVGARVGDQRLQVLDGWEDQGQIAGRVALQRLARRDPGGLRDLRSVGARRGVSRGQGDVEASVEPHRDELGGDPARPASSSASTSSSIPASSCSSRTAQARWAASSSPASPGSTRPPGNTQTPGMKLASRVRCTRSTSTPRWRCRPPLRRRIRQAAGRGVGEAIGDKPRRSGAGDAASGGAPQAPGGTPRGEGWARLG